MGITITKKLIPYVEEFIKENPNLGELFLTEDNLKIYEFLKSKNSYYEVLETKDNFYIVFGEILNEFFNKHNITAQDQKNTFVELWID